jgi:hypothetical protein
MKIRKKKMYYYSNAVFIYLTTMCQVYAKEVIKEQPTPRNLSATARRVLQCTRSLGLCTFTVAAPQKYFSAILAVQRQQLIKYTTTMAAE